MALMTGEYNQKFYLLGAVLAGLAGGYALQFVSGNMQACISTQHCALRTTMRKLWADHVVWTRNYIISAIADLEDLKAVTDRLLRNQQDLGAAIGSYYGKEAGDKAAALLKDHILIAADLVAAAKAGNEQGQQEANERWHKNAEEMAHFLSSANKAWKYTEMLKMLNHHLDLTAKEAVFRLKKQWSEDVTHCDAIFDQASEMADGLTAGIVAQFPEKF